MTTIKATAGGSTLVIRANFAIGSSRIEYQLRNGDWDITPFQVGDCKHREMEAVKLVNRWLDSRERLPGSRSAQSERKEKNQPITGVNHDNDYRRTNRTNGRITHH